MIKNKLISVFLLFSILSTSMFAYDIKICELNEKEKSIYSKILNKVNKGSYDKELFNLIPDNYKSFQKIFVYLSPKQDNDMENQKFTNNMNDVINEKEFCSANLRKIEIKKFMDLFLTMQKNNKVKYTEKSIKILAGPWTADNFLEFGDYSMKDLFNPKNKITIKVLENVEPDIIEGLIMRYNTTNRANRECDRKYYGTGKLCPIEIPDYALKMPKNIQQRFEKAKEELLK